MDAMAKAEVELWEARERREHALRIDDHAAAAAALQDIDEAAIALRTARLEAGVLSGPSGDIADLESVLARLSAADAEESSARRMREAVNAALSRGLSGPLAFVERYLAPNVAGLALDTDEPAAHAEASDDDAVRLGPWITARAAPDGVNLTVNTRGLTRGQQGSVIVCQVGDDAPLALETITPTRSPVVHIELEGIELAEVRNAERVRIYAISARASDTWQA